MGYKRVFINYLVTSPLSEFTCGFTSCICILVMPNCGFNSINTHNLLIKLCTYAVYRRINTHSEGESDLNKNVDTKSAAIFHKFHFARKSHISCKVYAQFWYNFNMKENISSTPLWNIISTAAAENNKIVGKIFWNFPEENSANK